MAEERGPTGSEPSMAAALDAAAGALLDIWDAAREQSARLSGPQLRAVLAVEQQDGINLRSLAASLGMLLSSASRLCDRLVAAGMLEREPGRLDRREISLHLTAAARELLAELRAYRQQRLAGILHGMSGGGQRALLRGLREFGAVAAQQEPPGPPVLTDRRVVGETWYPPMARDLAEPTSQDDGPVSRSA